MKINITAKRPLVCVVVPGFGVNERRENSLISRARIPFLRSLVQDFPSAAFANKAGADVVRAWSDLAGGKADWMAAILSFFLVCDSATWPAADILLPGLPAGQTDFLPLAGAAPAGLAANVQAAGRTVSKMVKKEKYPAIWWLWGGLDRSAQFQSESDTAALWEDFDKIIKKLYKSLSARGGCLILTAPYGRAEAMLPPDASAIGRSVSANPVPLIIAHPELRGIDPGWGSIGDSDLSLLRQPGQSTEIMANIEKIIKISHE